jgi:hypothetical protein
MNEFEARGETWLIESFYKFHASLLFLCLPSLHSRATPPISRDPFAFTDPENNFLLLALIWPDSHIRRWFKQPAAHSNPTPLPPPPNMLVHIDCELYTEINWTALCTCPSVCRGELFLWWERCKRHLTAEWNMATSPPSQLHAIFRTRSNSGEMKFKL